MPCITVMVKIKTPKKESASDTAIKTTKADIKTKKSSKSIHKQDFISLNTAESDKVLTKVVDDAVEPAKKRKIAILPEEVDFVRGKKKRSAGDKATGVKSDNLFVSINST